VTTIVFPSCIGVSVATRGIGVNVACADVFVGATVALSRDELVTHPPIARAKGIDTSNNLVLILIIPPIWAG
jgi:hypothetical protein